MTTVTIDNKALKTKFEVSGGDNENAIGIVMTGASEMAPIYQKAILKHLKDQGYQISHSGDANRADAPANEKGFYISFSGAKVDQGKLSNDLQKFLTELDTKKAIDLSVASAKTGHDASHQEFFAANIKPQPKSNVREV